MIRPFTLTIMLGLTLCLVFTGCSTPNAVRTLAKTTAINASLVETKIASFNKSSEEIYRGRAEAAEILSQAIERSRTEIDAYFESAASAATIAGATKKPHYGTVISELRRVSTSIQVRQAAALARRGETRAEALAEYNKLEKPPIELSTIATNLTGLAEKQSYAERVESLKSFYNAIAEGLDNIPGAGVKPATGDAGAKDKTSSMIDSL